MKLNFVPNSWLYEQEVKGWKDIILQQSGDWHMPVNDTEYSHSTGS
jgi:hypothetical protein